MDGKSIGVFNVHGEFFAILNRCPHQGAPLCLGEIVSDYESSRPGEYRLRESASLLVCPWHNWEFDVRTGRSYWDPARTRVRAYATSVERGRVPGPYQADRFPVTVEDEYVVVRVPG